MLMRSMHRCCWGIFFFHTASVVVHYMRMSLNILAPPNWDKGSLGLCGGELMTKTVDSIYGLFALLMYIIILTGRDEMSISD